MNRAVPIPRSNRRALLIVDSGTLEHNTEVIDRLRKLFELEVQTYNSTGVEFVRRRKLAKQEAGLLAALLAKRRLFGRRTLLICASGHYAALAVSKLLGLVGRDAKVVLFNFYLHSLGTRAIVRRGLSLLLTDRVLVVAQSPADHDYFASLTDRAKIVLLEYRQGPIEGVGDRDVELGDYVFAGGYTNRDYDTLIRCARGAPGIPFVVACSHLNRITEPVPPNVEIRRDLDPETFHRLLARSRLVVIPLAKNVGASGQMVTLAAMQLGKATVVADSPVVTQYVEQGTSGIVYRLGSEDALRESIVSVYDDRQKLTLLGEAARERYYQRFTPSALAELLVDAIANFAYDECGACQEDSVASDGVP